MGAWMRLLGLEGPVDVDRERREQVEERRREFEARCRALVHQGVTTEPEPRADGDGQR